MNDTPHPGHLKRTTFARAGPRLQFSGAVIDVMKRDDRALRAIRRRLMNAPQVVGWLLIELAHRTPSSSEHMATSMLKYLFECLP